MKILITGSLGNLGTWMTRHFLQLGEEVIILSRSDRKLSGLEGYRHIVCDLVSRSDCQEKLRGERFDAVIHLASANDTFVDDYPDKALKINTLGTRNLIEATIWEGLRRFVYFSTFHVYGVGSGEITEASPTSPRHDYATTHLFAEEYVRQFFRTHGLPHAILRLTNGYGCPIDSSSDKWYLLLNDLARMAFKEEKISLKSNGLAQRDFIWMDDVVRAAEKILKSDLRFNDSYNLGSGQSLRLIDVAERVKAAHYRKTGRHIEIETNSEDSTIHDEPLIVHCEKLRNLIPLSTSDRIEKEAFAIFDLLENTSP